MPRTVETTVYMFDELSDRAKETARGWFREATSVDFSSFTGPDVVSDCIDALEKLGFTIDRKRGVSWSGFNSQGDGASFVGSWYARDCQPAEVIADRPTDTDLKDLAEGLAAMRAKYPGDLAAIITRRSHHYAHELTVHVDVEYDIDESDDENVAEMSDEDADAITELCRDAMRWIYRQLESAYDWEMSDECVDENIRANEQQRPAWERLPEYARFSWAKNPTPRDWPLPMNFMDCRGEV